VANQDSAKLNKVDCSIQHDLKETSECSSSTAVGAEVFGKARADMTRNSYCCGITEEPLLYQTIGEALSRAARLYPDQDAAVFLQQNRRQSYRELQETVRTVAGNLLKLGLAPGDRLGIWSPNRLEWVVTQFAAAQIGIILVTINPAYRVIELESVLNKTGVKALIAADRFKNSNYIELLDDVAPEIKLCSPGETRSERLPHLTHVIHLSDHSLPGMFCFSELYKDLKEDDIALLSAVEKRLQPDDPINIQFSSGTTGLPKGITLTHFNILNNGYFMTARMGLRARDRLCIPVPLYHCYGMVMGVLGCLTHGATMIFPDEAFAPKSVLSAIQSERCTALFGVPTMYIAILSDPDFGSYDVSSLRTGNMGGASVPADTMRQVIERMNMKGVTNSYGMTETSPISFQTQAGDPFDIRINTVGRIHPHLEAKVIDEAGKVVPVGQRGELCIRGYSVMRGYWEAPEETVQAIDEAGWMHTGDLVVFDEEFVCRVVGRVKDMINRGGENISPAEVESYLIKYPKIMDVTVFGVPDARFGEAVAAWIRLHAGLSADAEEIREFCRNRIAHYKIPAHIRFVDEFPVTASGKVQKFVIREQMTRELALKALELN
jgi:fatty-acyl-CoA synthase